MASMSSQTTSPRGIRFLSGDSRAGFDTAFVDRVRLYLKVTFIVNVAFSVITVLVYASGGDGSVPFSAPA